MAEIALQALYKAVDARLEAAGANFGNRVTVSVAPSNKSGQWPYPYVIQFWQSGGEDNSLTTQDARFIIGVKCVGDFADAFRGAAAISAALNDKGVQDDPDDFLNGGTDWDILTCTENDAIFIVEQLSDSEIVYHVGASYDVVMVVSS